MKKNLFSLVFLVGAVLLTGSCGVLNSYSTSYYDDGIYYKPSKLERIQLAQRANEEAVEEETTSYNDYNSYAYRLRRFDEPFYRFDYGWTWWGVPVWAAGWSWNWGWYRPWGPWDPWDPWYRPYPYRPWDPWYRPYPYRPWHPGHHIIVVNPDRRYIRSTYTKRTPTSGSGSKYYHATGNTYKSRYTSSHNSSGTVNTKRSGTSSNTSKTGVRRTGSTTSSSSNSSSNINRSSNSSSSYNRSSSSGYSGGGASRTGNVSGGGNHTGGGRR